MSTCAINLDFPEDGISVDVLLATLNFSIFANLYGSITNDHSVLQFVMVSQVVRRLNKQERRNACTEGMFWLSVLGSNVLTDYSFKNVLMQVFLNVVLELVSNNKENSEMQNQNNVKLPFKILI